MASNERSDKLVTDYVQHGKGCKYSQKIKKKSKKKYRIETGNVQRVAAASSTSVHLHPAFVGFPCSATPTLGVFSHQPCVVHL
jgi:hypothetical protein